MNSTETNRHAFGLQKVPLRFGEKHKISGRKNRPIGRSQLAEKIINHQNYQSLNQLKLLAFCAISSKLTLIKQITKFTKIFKPFFKQWIKNTIRSSSNLRLANTTVSLAEVKKSKKLNIERIGCHSETELPTALLKQFNES